MCPLSDSLLGIEEGKKICFLTYNDPKNGENKMGPQGRSATKPL